MTRTAGAQIGCQRPSRFWGLGCPKIYHEAEDTLEKGLLHSTIGHNGDPESKMNDFQTFLDKRLGDTQPDMAMLKFCYVDISKKTDVPALVKEGSSTF